MANQIAKIGFWTNNKNLEIALMKLSSPGAEYQVLDSHHQPQYVEVFVDLSKNLDDITQKIIAIYDQALRLKQKIAVVLIHSKQVDGEKNLYFSDLLDKIGQERTVHRLVVVKDLFTGFLKDPITALDQYLSDAVKSNQIDVSSKGNNKLYPIALTDLLLVLQKILYLNSTAGKIYWITGDEEKDLSIAYLVKKTLEEESPDVFDINAVSDNKTESVDIQNLGNRSRVELNWEPDIDIYSLLNQQIKAHLNEIRENPNRISNRSQKKNNFDKIRSFVTRTINHLYQKKPKTKITNNLNNTQDFIKRYLEYFVSFVILVYATFTIGYLIALGGSVKYLELGLEGIRSGNLKQSVKNVKASESLLELGEWFYSFFSPALSLVTPSFNEVNHSLFVFIDYSTGSLKNLQQTYLLAEKTYLSLGEDSDPNLFSNLSLALSSNLSQLYENITQIHLLVTKGTLPRFIEAKIKNSREYQNLEKISSQIEKLIKVTELIPALIPSGRANNIVILAQNSLHPRSTGGIIEYLVVITIENGRVVSKKIYRSDEIDRLLLDKAIAPPLLKMYTGVDEWKFRDFNYNPDFPQTATNISWLIEKTLKFSPDIIIAVNDSLIDTFLNEEHKVNLNSQTITAQDFQKDIESNSPSYLYSQLLDYYTGAVLKHELPLVQLGRVLADQINRGQIYLWSSDEHLEKSIYNQNYSGAIFPGTCHSLLSGSKNCLTQTTYLNTSEYSFMKFKKYLEQKTQHSVIINPNNLIHRYNLELTPKEKMENSNRDWLFVYQVYAPIGSDLKDVVLNGKSVPLRGFTRETYNNLERLQIPVTMPINQKNQLVINIQSPNTLKNTGSFAFTLIENYQPGLKTGDIELQLSYPDNIRPSALTSPADIGPNNVRFVLPAGKSAFGLNFVPVGQ